MSQGAAVDRQVGYPSGVARGRAAGGLYGHVVESLGSQIVGGHLPTGFTLVTDYICEQLGASRSVVREAIRTLGAMGLVDARPQVGTRVTSQESWDLLNPRVIQWRAAGADYLVQHRELLELRLGLEPVAARLAATRASDSDTQALIACAETMVECVDRQDSRTFFELDGRFHRILMRSGGNAVLAQFADTVAAVLEARSTDARPGVNVLERESADLHLLLARAVADRNVELAEQHARVVVSRTLAGFQRLD